MPLSFSSILFSNSVAKFSNRNPDFLSGISCLISLKFFLSPNRNLSWSSRFCVKGKGGVSVRNLEEKVGVSMTLTNGDRIVIRKVPESFPTRLLCLPTDTRLIYSHSWYSQLASLRWWKSPAGLSSLSLSRVPVVRAGAASVAPHRPLPSGHVTRVAGKQGKDSFICLRYRTTNREPSL